MRPPRMLDRLAQLAAAMRDQRLDAMRLAQARREEIVAQLAALDLPSPCDLPLVSTAGVELVYARWIETRRRALHRQLAQQEAQCRDALAEARLAFGKAQVLRGLAADKKLTSK